MPKFLLSTKAAQDILEIKAYLTDKAGNVVSRRVVGNIRSAFQFLGRNPGAGHSREDLSVATDKYWPVYSYLIIYDPAKQPIEILRVLHGRRDIAAIIDHDDSL